MAYIYVCRMWLWCETDDITSIEPVFDDRYRPRDERKMMVLVYEAPDLGGMPDPGPYEGLNNTLTSRFLTRAEPDFAASLPNVDRLKAFDPASGWIPGSNGLHEGDAFVLGFVASDPGTTEAWQISSTGPAPVTGTIHARCWWKRVVAP